MNANTANPDVDHLDQLDKANHLHVVCFVGKTQ